MINHTANFRDFSTDIGQLEIDIACDKIGCGTKQPILKRDKTADFQNGAKQPIFKTQQNSRFSKLNKMNAVTANMHGT